MIDDVAGRTLAAASTRRGRRCELGRGQRERRPRPSAALASRAKAAGITTVVFDRGGFGYHGRVAALADAARSGGLEF